MLIVGAGIEQHPPVFSASLKVYDELIDDPFASGLIRLGSL